MIDWAELRPSGLHHDFGKWLEELAPFNPDPNHYHHNRTGEDNADAHLKRQIMGREVVVAIKKGKGSADKKPDSSPRREP